MAGLQNAPSSPADRRGQVIWARCSHADQLSAVATLQRKLGEDGDAIQIVATVQGATGDHAAPQGRESIRAFITRWRPVMVVWLHGDLDPVLLGEMRAAGIPGILVNAASHGLDHIPRAWLPGKMRALVSDFAAVLAIDAPAADRIIKAGALRARVAVTGPMEDCGTVLPCNESDRRDIAAAIGTRQVWLAASARVNETATLCHAQQQASRRAHRLLLIVVPADPADAAGMAAGMRRAGCHVTLRSDQADPAEAAQIHIVDTDEGLGLWYRVSPVTYLGGTLFGGGCRDPFEATALGSAVVYGPHLAPFARHAERLNAANAARRLVFPGTLGPTIETLLAPDKTAELAHAAWDATSRGADVTNRIAAMIRNQTEGAGI